MEEAAHQAAAFQGLPCTSISPVSGNAVGVDQAVAAAGRVQRALAGGDREVLGGRRASSGLSSLSWLASRTEFSAAATLSWPAPA